MSKLIFAVIFLHFFLLGIPEKSHSAEILSPEKKALVFQCLELGAKNFQIPLQLLLGIYAVEQSLSISSSIKVPHYGVMNLTEEDVAYLAKAWNMSIEEVRSGVKEDPCTNIGALSYRFRAFINEERRYPQALVRLGEYKGYNGIEYRDKVIASTKSRSFSQRNNTELWYLLTYSWETMIKHPAKMSSLKECLSVIKSLERTDSKTRFQCLNYETGALYTSRGILREKWNKNFPKELQLGKRAPWLD